MDNRFSKIYLPEMVMSFKSDGLDNITVGDLCSEYRRYSDYDYDGENVDWGRLRLRRLRIGGRKALVLDYRTREYGAGYEYSIITYSADNTQPVRCYSLFYDSFSIIKPIYVLSEHIGDMTSERLQQWPFEISWHTAVEAVRIHEQQKK